MTDCAGIQHRKKKDPGQTEEEMQASRMILYRESIQSIVVVVSVRETREIPFSGEIEDLFFGRSGGGYVERAIPRRTLEMGGKREENREIGGREKRRRKKKKKR